MYTRDQYMNHEVTHQEYYGQFVTPHIAAMVQAFMEGEGWPDPVRALEVDPHLNQIRLRAWDHLAGDVFGWFYTDGYTKRPLTRTLSRAGFELQKKLKEAGEAGMSPSDMTCTLKAAVHLLASK